MYSIQFMFHKQEIRIRSDLNHSVEIVIHHRINKFYFGVCGFDDFVLPDLPDRRLSAGVRGGGGNSAVVL